MGELRVGVVGVCDLDVGMGCLEESEPRRGVVAISRSTDLRTGELPSTVDRRDSLSMLAPEFRDRLPVSAAVPFFGLPVRDLPGMATAGDLGRVGLPLDGGLPFCLRSPAGGDLRRAVAVLDFGVNVSRTARTLSGMGV